MPLFRRLAALRAAFSDPQIPAVASVNAFALDLYAALGAKRGNLFFSPFNIAVALAMAASGARGQTAAEMHRALRLTLPPAQADAELGEALRTMMAGRDEPPPPPPALPADKPESPHRPHQTLQPRRGARLAAPHEPLQLCFANAVWLASDLALETPYEHSMVAHYDGSLRRVDFKADPEAARQTINQWVATQTRDRILNLFARPLCGPMVLTAAVYLKADWEVHFAEHDTQDGEFHTADGSTAPARLMNKGTMYRYLEGDGFQAISSVLPRR